jgi:ACS family hexuronate transporter-like MFS transporter
MPHPASVPTEDKPAQHPGMTGKRGGLRWKICALLFFATAINYMDRQLIGILKPMLEQDLGWNEIDYSNIVVSFQCAYAAGYLFAGRLMDVVGVRLGLGVAIVVWSLFTMVHGLARSVSGFALARFGLGLAEGGNFPGAVKAVGEWFPQKDRAFATGIFNAGSSVGAMAAPLFVPWIAVTFGWPVVFYIAGGLGLLLALFWFAIYFQPDRHPRVSTEELAYIRAGQDLRQGPKISWASLLKYKPTWAFALGMLATSPVWWFYLFWIPGFLNKAHGIDVLHIGPPLFAIYLMSDLGSVLGGWLPKKLIGAGWSVRSARITSMGVCVAFVLPLFLISLCSVMWGAVVLIGLAAAAHQGWSANLYTLVSDTMPRSAVSSVVGIGGMAGGIGGMFAAKAIGYILEWTGSYLVLFCLAPLSYLFALGLIAFLTRHSWQPGGPEY